VHAPCIQNLSNLIRPLDMLKLLFGYTQAGTLGIMPELLFPRRVFGMNLAMCFSGRSNFKQAIHALERNAFCFWDCSRLSLLPTDEASC